MRPFGKPILRARLPLIDTVKLLKDKIEMVEALGSIELRDMLPGLSAIGTIVCSGWIRAVTR